MPRFSSMLMPGGGGFTHALNCGTSAYRAPASSGAKSTARRREVARRIDDNAVTSRLNGAVGGVVDVATAHDEQRERKNLGLGAAARLLAPPCR